MTEFPTGTVTFMFTDVVDSTRLWEEHHDAMGPAMAAHDGIVKDAISAGGGVFLKQTGDGAFAVFASAFDAIAAAISIQLALRSHSWETPAPLTARIGVHTGEAEIRNGDYFGSTVNRAARVMSLGKGGEVLLSAATQEVVRDRLPTGLMLRDVGERDLKGMARPEHVFSLVPTSDHSGPAEEPASSPARDANDAEARRAAWIAVLPFENLSGDPDQDYFAEGIAEDVITGLAAFRSLRVIARTSSFHYKGSEASINQIAEDLGVRFVLEGSVRKVGNRVRVTAQLVEAPGRHHVWADRFDADLIDVFDVQDQITGSIVVAIHPAIRLAEVERVRKGRPDNMDAWDHVQRGWSLYFRYKKDSKAQAMRHFERAAELDPEYADAHVGLSSGHLLDAWLLWGDDPAASLEAAYAEAKRAVELDDRDAAAHTAVAAANYAMGRLESAVQAADRAIDLNPGLPNAYVFGGVAKIHGGDPESGIKMLERAIALNPRDPMANFLYGGKAVGHFLLHQLQAAEVDARRGIALRYGYLFGRVVLTASLVEMGRTEEARNEVAVILSIDPEFNPSRLDLYTFSNESDRRRLIDGLRAAGLES